jgi:hypothetical protein
VFVGISRLELRVPDSGSLKAKRHVLKSILGGLRSKFNVAAAEIDNQDLWQRASIGVACVSETQFHVRKMLHEIEKFVEREDRVELLSASSDVQSWKD